MKLERVNINGKSYYFVDGAKINGDALKVVMCGLFGEDVTTKIYRDVISRGVTFVERYLGDGNAELIAQRSKLPTRKSHCSKTKWLN